MKNYLLLISLSVFTLWGQVEKDTTLAYDYEYILPIWGQKVADRGYKLPMPLGLNVNYVNNQMDLDVTDFGMSIGSDLTSPLNDALASYINLETLNFQKTNVVTNGMNVRADAWILPMVNVYGIYSTSSGSTEVVLQPTWYDNNGDLVLSLPQFGSTVNFNATSWGVGTTLVYGYLNYFVSVDANYTLSNSEILTEPAQFLVTSARIGERIDFKNDWKLAVYIGAMRRGFVDSDGNFGTVTFEQVFPELGGHILPAIDDKIVNNNNQIAALDPSSPSEALQIAKLEKQNEVLYSIDGAVETAIGADINYDIKKDIVNNWSVQFGFNLELSESWMIRGEFGKGAGNSFAMTGVQYRFGL